MMKLFLYLASGLLWTQAVGQENVCFMLYQMADNDLERFIREDNYELIQSPAIREPSVTTWVYFDGRNYLGTGEDITEPLKEIYYSDGSPVVTKITGSQYMRWDHSIQKMVLDSISTVELDSDSIVTVYNFVATALLDCVAKGSTEYFLVFSSHGGGFFGFGGDDHDGRQLFPQPNQGILVALTQALADVAGAPAQFDVLGFDACLMQAVGAADEYRDVARYYLASEATEPGHGWAYDSLNNVNSALDMALDIQKDFLEQPQGLRHLTPKTLAIIDTQAFTKFLLAWEALMAEFTFLLDDPDFFTHLQRARAQSRDLPGILDGSGRTKSALDIGDFLTTFGLMCAPAANSQLQVLVEDALSTYDDMFVARGVGPGTSAALTGMHVTWPIRKQYFEEPKFYDLLLFNATLIYVTDDAPNYLALLQSYYYANTPPETTVDSVCTQSTTSSLAPTRDGQLLLNPSLMDSGSEVTVASEVTRNTDTVRVEYGIDLTPLLSNRRLREAMSAMGGHASRPGFSWSRATPRIHSDLRKMNDILVVRKTQVLDSLILFGGGLLGSYTQSLFSATWDRKFYLLADDTDTEFVYAQDLADGLKFLPVFYFSPATPVTSNDFPIGTSEEDVLALGGMYGFVGVPTEGTGDTVSSIDLYTYNAVLRTLSETPTSAGGYIVPIVLVQGQASGSVTSQVLVGGFRRTVFEWTTGSGLKVLAASAEDIVEIYGVNTLVVEMTAYDEDQITGAGIDSASFEIKKNEGTDSPGEPSTNSPTEMPNVRPTSSPAEMPSVLPTPSPVSDISSAATKRPTEPPSAAMTWSPTPASSSASELAVYSTAIVGMILICFLAD